MFRGYVNTRNKECMMRFKGVPDDQLLTWEQANSYDEFAGILDKDTILIDIDDTEQSERLYQIVTDLKLSPTVVRTTRGMHFFWKNPGVEKCGVKIPLACGLSADIKIGTKNSYAIVKYGGVVRETMLSAATLPTMPKWLMPVYCKTNFAEMAEGDGRNTAIYKYILTLLRSGLTKDEAREAIRILNDYVLAEPLESDELENVIRDDAFPEDLWPSGKKFVAADFGDFLISQYSLRRIGGRLHIYQNGRYVADDNLVERAMITEMRTISRDKRSEVLAYIKICAPDVELADERYIAFANGIYDLETGLLMDHSPDYVMANIIPWNYAPGAYCADTDRVLNNMACKDKEIRNIMEEMIGYCFYRRNELGKAFFLTGEKANGKSTYIKMLQCLLGSSNYSAMDLAQFKDKFAAYDIGYKLANLGDDIADTYLDGDGAATFKKLVTGDAISAQIKFDPQMYVIRSYAKLIFSANDLPRSKDRSGAVFRRLCIVPFNATFTKDDPDYDPYIIKKLTTRESMEYLIQLGLSGLKRVLANYAFTDSVVANAEMDEYNRENNPLIDYLDENDVMNKPTASCYEDYKTYADACGLKPLTRKAFTTQVKRLLSCETAMRGSRDKRESTFVTKESA